MERKKTYVVRTDVSPMFVATNAQYERARFIVLDRRLSVGFDFGLRTFLRSFLFLLLLCDGSVFFDKRRSRVEQRRGRG